MAESVSQLIEKFRLTEKCVHCKRCFNIYNYFSSHLSSNTKLDSSLNLPLILACGHNACEKCVQIDYKNGKCDECHEVEINCTQSWNNPRDLYLIDEYKEKIRKTLTASEIKQFDRLSFDQITKSVTNTKIEIQSGLIAIAFKCTKRCSSELISKFKLAIEGINELAELRARSNDVDTMIKKLVLSKAIFEQELKMQEFLNADLSAMSELPSPIVESRIKNYITMEPRQKLDAIINMIENGVEVVAGHRIDGELHWAPVSVESNNVFVSSLSKNYRPGNKATLIQYRWLQPTISASNLPNYVYLEISINEKAAKDLKISTPVTKKFKLIIKVRDINGHNYDSFNYSPEMSFLFSQMFTGEKGLSFTGKGVLTAFKAIFLLAKRIPVPEKLECHFRTKTSSLRPGAIFTTNVVYRSLANYSIVVNKEGFASDPIGPVLAEVESGLCYLHQMCDRVLYDQIEQTFVKITDCGLVFKTSTDSQN